MPKNLYMDRNNIVDRDRQYEVLDPHSETEQAGYIPPQIQIENMMLAGQRLDSSRRALYDFPDAQSIDESLSDPTRAANFDLADASQTSQALEMSFFEQRRISQQAADDAKSASQTAQKGLGGEPEPVKGA